MRKLMAAADDVVIDKICQPAVDWMSRFGEADCFRIARVCVDLAAFAWILSQANSTIAAVNSGITGLAAFQFTLIILGLAAIMTLRSVFDRSAGAGDNGKGRWANPLRPRMFFHRLICLSSLLMQALLGADGFDAIALLLVQALATMAVYAGACSNGMPKTRENGFNPWGLVALKLY